MLSLVNEWLKAATLEVQEYVLLCSATWAAAFTRPIYYRDIIQQFANGWFPIHNDWRCRCHHK